MTLLDRPLVVILDGSVDVTGALVAAARGATLLRDRARFLLVLPSQSRVTAKDLPADVELATLPSFPLQRRLGSIVAYLPGTWLSASRLKRLLSERQAAVLQVNDFYLLPGFMVRALGWRGRVIGLVRIDPRRFGLAGRVWLAAARRWSDELLAVSHFIASVSGEPRLPVVLESAPPAPDRAEMMQSRPERLLFIGNYIPGKGQDAAIRAFHQVAADFPSAELHFCGGTMGLAKNEAYRGDLERLAGQGPGAARIRFDGFAADTRKLLTEARASLTLSHSESFSLTCQEASAHGVPVIATRCGGPEEIVEDGVTGFLVDIDDVAAIADRMARLLGDPDRAQRMGQAAATLMAQRFGRERWVVEMGAALGV